MSKRAKKQYVVIGLGRFGRSVAKSLEANGCSVLAIDEDEKKVNLVSEYVTSAMCLDISNEDAANELGLGNFDGAVISKVNSLEKAVLATICVKEKGVKQVVVEAYDDTQAKVLKKLGAVKIVFPEREMGKHLANNLSFDNFVDTVELSNGYSVVEIHVPHAWVGKNLIELKLRTKYEVNVIAIKHNNNTDVTLAADKPLLEGDILVMLGENEVLKKLSKAV